MPKQVWQSDDGTQFDNEKDCLLYEKFLEELCNKDIPQELRYLPNGETSQSIAKNFYEVLESTRKCLSFLESIEHTVAPNEKTIRKAEKEAAFKSKLRLKILFEQEEERKEKLKISEKEKLEKLKISKENEVKQFYANLWGKLSRMSCKGKDGVEYWQIVRNRQVQIGQDEWAEFAEMMMKFHEKNISTVDLHWCITNEISYEVLIMIVDDIDSRHHSFAW